MKFVQFYLSRYFSGDFCLERSYHQSYPQKMWKTHLVCLGAINKKNSRVSAYLR